MATTRLPTRPAARPLVLLVSIAMLLGLALVASATPAEAASCTNASCHGKWPHVEGCTPGTEFGAVFFRDGKARIAMRRSQECGTPRWARLVWDGSGSSPPFRFQFTIYRREWFGQFWAVTHAQRRTTDGSEGVFLTKMIADTSGFNAEYRACAKSAVSTGGGSWGSWSSSTCTDWRFV